MLVVTVEHRPQTNSGAEASLFTTVIGSASEVDLLKLARSDELDIKYQKIATRERTNMITSGSALASTPEECDAPKLMPPPPTQNTETDAQRQDPVSFEGISKFVISYTFPLLTCSATFATGTNSLTPGASPASESDALKLMLSMCKIRQTTKQLVPVRFEDTSLFVCLMNPVFANMLF